MNQEPMEYIIRAKMDNFAEEENIALNSKAFLRLYHDDGLGHLIKNVDFWIKDTFEVLNSFK
jgi:hypothetical protein